MLRRICVVSFALAGVAVASPASGQLLGAFTWQLQPFCNVLTLNVTLTGGIYMLDGYDDQCGAATRASATGLAFQNPDGSIGMGVAIIVSPGGAPLHVSAAITLPSASGTWRDSSGNIGTLAFNPGPPTGSPRPLPKPIFVGGLSAGNARITNVAAPAAFTDAATKGYADSLVAGVALPPASHFEFQPNGSFVALGTLGVGSIPASGAGGRIVWHGGKGAFRAGVVNGPGWNDANIGQRSVAFGEDTRATAHGSTALGLTTVASGSGSVAAGHLTNATGDSSVAMGSQTDATGFASTAMGSSTTASGITSVAMGINTTATGHRSFALGSYATTFGQEGAFVYGDSSTSTLLQANAANQFSVRAAGGVRFFSSADTTPPAAGVQLLPGASAWTNLSDARSKHLFRDLNGEDVLARLAAMPIREWSYKAQDAAIRHVGPTAQDFRAAFGLGEDPLGITTIDADGIALRAIQALAERTRREREALAAENAALRAELAALRKAITARRGVEP